MELALEPTMRSRGSGLLDLIRIKMKNLLEVSEIVESAIIDEYLSKVGTATRHDVLHWFTRERIASHNDSNDGALGRPHVLRLANRVESYVDIEKKVMRLPNAGRSMSSQVDPKAPASASASASASATESGYESNAELDSESSDAVSGIMV